MKYPLILSSALTTVLCRPSEIVFRNEAVTSLFSGKCDLITGEVLWEEDQKCYNIGKRGPCKQNEILSINSSRKPFCLSVGPPVAPKQSNKDDKVVEFKNDLKCEEEWKVEYNGSCYTLLEQGPCQIDQWLVTSDETGQIGTCVTRPCDSVTMWWPELCQCVGPGTPWSVADICGQEGGMVWSPHGEAVCTQCQHGHLPDQHGQCHELGTVGPCTDDQLWLEDDEGSNSNDNQVRLLELIPDSGSRTAQNFKCYADENGKCRKSLLVRRFGEDESFTEWISSFKRRGSNSEKCTTVKCPDDQVLWTDGQCYQLASTGPCDPGHWLVLDTIVDSVAKFQCQQRRCEEDQVWWSPDCSCVTLTSSSDAADVKLKSGSVSPCGETESLLISPYGDGVCVQQQQLNNRIFELIPESGSSATRIKCYADEQGKCRRGLGIRSRINAQEEESESSALADLITWLEQFQKPSVDHCQKCESEDQKDKAGVIDVDVFVNSLENSSETECHREGKVLFEDGECYNLLERGPCFDQSMWLIMTVEADGSLVPQCRPRQCVQVTSVWDPVTCQCHQGSMCEGSDQVYLDIFGQAMCGANADDNDDDDEDGDKVSDEEQESVTRKSADVNDKLTIMKATSSNCVINSSGHCTENITVEKNLESDEAQVYQNWLKSFKVRSPDTFVCLDE